jgi:PAS domain S-box-containing protein
MKVSGLRIKSLEGRLSVLVVLLAILPTATVGWMAHDFIITLPPAEGLSAVTAFEKKAAGTVAALLLPLILAALCVARRRAQPVDSALRLTQLALDKVSMTVAMMRLHDGRFIYANDRACRDFGYSREELLGMTVFDVNPEISPARWAELNRELRNGSMAALETTHRARDGREYPVEVSATLVEIGGEEYHVGFAQEITQHRMAKETLRKSEASLRAALDNLPYRTWIKDTESRYVLINKVYAEHVKLDNPADAAGKTDLDLHPREIAERYRAEDIHIMQSGKRKHVEVQAVEEGQVRWLETFKTPIIDQDGKLLGTVGFARDITDRKTEDEQLQLVLATSLDGYWTTDLHGRFLEVNDAYCELLGYSRGELLAMTILDVEAIEHPEETARHVEKIIATGHDRFETRHRARDGRILEVEVSVTYTPMRGGRLYCFLRDISARKTADRVLLEQRSNLEREVARRTAELTCAHGDLKTSFEETDDLYQRAPCGYHSTDGSGLIVRMNDTELSWLGYAREELVGKKRTAELLAPQRRAQFHAEFLLLKERGTLHGIETEFVRKDGSVMSALVNVSAVQGENGEFIMSRATVYDITERKKADEVLRFHSQILGNLSEGVVLVRASDGVIAFTNARFDQMFGGQSGELIGQHVSVLNAPGEQSPEQVARAINQELTTKGAWSGEVHNARKDGTAFWCHVHVTAFDHPEYGEVWVAVHEDIDERKRTEQTRLRQDRALRLLSEGNLALIHALGNRAWWSQFVAWLWKRAVMPWHGLRARSTMRKER